MTMDDSIRPSQPTQDRATPRKSSSLKRRLILCGFGLLVIVISADATAGQEAKQLEASHKKGVRHAKEDAGWKARKAKANS